MLCIFMLVYRDDAATGKLFQYEWNYIDDHVRHDASDDTIRDAGIQVSSCQDPWKEIKRAYLYVKGITIIVRNAGRASPT